MSTPEPQEEHQPGGLRGRSILARIGVVILAIGLVALAGRWFGAQIQPFESWIDGLGFWGPIAFCAIFILFTGLQLPESIMAVAAGVAFGLGEGLVILVAVNFMGAILWFWVARKFLRGTVRRILARHPRMEAVEKATALQGFKLIVLLRLGPFSYGALNFMLGASDVRFRPYCLALVGVVPGNFATVYFGSMAKHVASKAAHADNLSDTHFAIMAVGFAVTVAVVAMIAKIAHDSLKRYQLEVVAPAVQRTSPAS